MNNQDSLIGDKQISNKLPIISIVFIAVLALGFVFMTSPKYKYEKSTEEMLSIVLERNDVIRPQKFMDITYNDDKLYRFIDLRSAHDFIKGHLPGAINIPIHKLLADEYNEILNQDEKINVLYYTDQCGACGPWMVLEQLGYKNNKILQGGYDYVKKYIIEQYSPMSGNFSSEKAKYDYAKIINETSGGSTTQSSSKSTAAKPVIKKKKAEKEEGGGC